MAKRSGSGERLTDAALIERSRREPEMFGLLFERHRGRLLERARALVGASDAEDVVAEAFLRAFEGRDRYDTHTHTHTSALPWLRGSVRNVALGLLRRREIEHRIRAVAELTSDDETDAVCSRVDAGREPVRLALLRMSPRNRRVLLLAASGLSHREIARRLGIPPGTVRSRLHRVRQRAKELLTQAEPMERRP